MMRSLCFSVIATVFFMSNVGHAVTWDFEDPDGDGVFDDHGFTLRGLFSGEPEDLPTEGSAWSVGKPNRFDETEPIVVEGCHVDDDGLLFYNSGCNQPFPYDPDVDSNDRGQDGYLDTYALSQWGDGLHDEENDQIATSPPILLPDNALMQVWSVGSDARYFAPELEDASRLPKDEADGYVTGSSGVAVISEEDGSLLDSLQVASNGGAVTEDELDLSAHAGKVVRIEVVDAFAGGWGWLAIDEITIEGATVLGGTPGDFNNNGELDIDDIDALSNEIQSQANGVQFDLNGDGNVDGTDLDVWVVDLKKTWFGDADLNGLFDSSDFVAVFSVGEYEDGVEKNSTWGDGDWTADGEFDSSDFVKAFSDGGFEMGVRPAAAAVPEPAGLSTWLVGSMLAAVALRRKRIARHNIAQ